MSNLPAGNAQKKRVSDSIHGKKTVNAVLKICRAKRASSVFMKIPFKDHILNIRLLGCHGTLRFDKKTSCHYEAKKQSPIIQKYLRQSQPTMPEREPKNADTIQFKTWWRRVAYGWNKQTWHFFGSNCKHVQCTINGTHYPTSNERNWSSLDFVSDSASMTIKVLV